MSSKFNRRDFLKLTALLTLSSSSLVHALSSAVAQPGNPGRPNILIIVFDTLSAMHLPLYGYSRDTAPNISRFAQKATVFHNHYAGGNFTTPGTASLLTGTYPWSHRAINGRGRMVDQYIPKNIFALPPPGTYTKSFTHNSMALAILYQLRAYLNELVMPRKLALADLEYSDLLFRRDYYTAHTSEYLTVQGQKIWNGSLFLSYFFRRIEHSRKDALDTQNKDQYPSGVGDHNPEYFLLPDGIDWAIEQTRTMPQPYLAYFHFLPPHEPFAASKDFAGLFNDDYAPPEKPESFATGGFKEKALNNFRKRYDCYIAYTDAEFGRLIDAMEKSGALSDTYVILTSDHGELFERGIFGHSTPTLYESIVRVPLIISKPNSQAHEDVYAPTSAVDMAPTIASIYGQPPPAWTEGQVLPTFTAQTAPADRPVFTVDSQTHSKFGPPDKGSFMVVQGDYKLVRYTDYPGQDELFNLANDPDELENLIQKEPAKAAELQGLISQKLAQVNQTLNGSKNK
jgi:arylsulfatase A-like enzyme